MNPEIRMFNRIEKRQNSSPTTATTTTTAIHWTLARDGELPLLLEAVLKRCYLVPFL